MAWLGWLIFKKKTTALVGAAGFALWPTQVEAVAWVAARSTLLSATFMLACLISANYYLADKSKKSLVLIYLFFVLAMLTKVVAVVLLPLLLLLFYYRRESVKRMLQLFWPMLLAIVAFSWLAFWLRQSGQGLWTNIPKQFWLVAIDLSDSFVWQLKLFIWPVNLVPYYFDHSQFFYDDINFYKYLVWQTWFSLVLALAFVVAMIIGWRKRLLAFSGGWFVCNLVPSLVLMYSLNQLGADRYNYLAILGWLWLSAELVRRYLAVRYQKIMMVVTVLFLSILSLLSWSQVAVWQSDVKMWQAVVMHDSTQNYATKKLLLAYFAAGLDSEAQAICGQMVQHLGLFLNCGELELFKTGNVDKAITYFNQEISLNPKATPYFRLAQSYAIKRDWVKVLANLEKAQGLYSQEFKTRNLGVDILQLRSVAYLNQKKYQQAATDLTAYLQINPGDAPMRYNLALAQMQLKQVPAACANLALAGSGNEAAQKLWQQKCQTK